MRTPAGALARGARILGYCRKVRGCFRKLELNLAWWCEHGFGDTQLDLIQRAHACGLVGCRIDWENERYDNGAPIQLSAKNEKAKVRVQCCVCALEVTYTIQQFIDRITTAGTGDGNTPELALSSTVVKPCKRCNQRSWLVAIQRLAP